MSPMGQSGLDDDLQKYSEIHVSARNRVFVFMTSYV